jgi:trehalose 6-phosphate phosphatase
MEYLLSAWPKILEQIQGAQQVLFLTDFDGTLTPLVERPEMAEIPQNTRHLLQVLASYEHITVGVISGRTLTDLKKKVNVDGIIYAGNHGFEIESPGMSFVYSIGHEIKPLLQNIRRTLLFTTRKTQGVFIEDKGIGLSVHYRQADEGKAGDLKKLVEEAIKGAPFKGLFKMTLGEKVYEISPAVNWDKGNAILFIINESSHGISYNNDFLPIYIGDDTTDEDAFRSIEMFGHGVTVRVGEPQEHSSAHYFLRSPDEVNSFLNKLLDHLQKHPICGTHSPT